MTTSVFERTVQTKGRLDWLNRYPTRHSRLSMRWYLYSKRALDLMICIAVLPFLLPIFALCAVLIKLDSADGPVFFVQERTGKNGRRFRMFKFRTMVANAEELKKQLVMTNEDGELARPMKLEHDPRITRVGRILRKTSLDELPQVLNVFLGEMSWVGPRPTSFGLKSYSLWHTERLDVTPGITGLWQLYSRGTTDFDSWLRFDIPYIQRRCLALDIEIIIRTFSAVFAGSGAR